MDLFFILIAINLIFQTVISDDDEDSHHEVKGSNLNCARHERLRNCNCKCKELCENKHHRENCPKKLPKVLGCYCMRGFYRNRNGQCVWADQCEQSSIYDINLGSSNVEPNNVSLVENVIPSKNEPLSEELQGEEIGKDNKMADKIYYQLETKNKTHSPIKKGVMSYSSVRNDVNNEDIGERNVHHDSPESEECGPNEMFFKCGNKCKESLDFIRKVVVNCPNDCSAGCYCQPGYFRDGFNNCNAVPIHLLEAVTGGKTRTIVGFQCRRKNEKYDDCGDRCIESLANLNNYTLCKPFKCLRGCYCADNFLRNKRGICVPAKRPYLFDDEDDDEEEDDGEDESREDVAHMDTNPGFRNKHDRHRHRSHLRRRPSHKYNHKYRVNTSGRRHRQHHSSRNLRHSHRNSWLKKLLHKYLHSGRRVPPGLLHELRASGHLRLKAGSSHNCRPRETYSECGNRCLEAMARNCDRNRCVSGCFCKPGLFRNSHDICIKYEPNVDSHQNFYNSDKCPPDERYHSCGNRCMESLDNILSEKRDCDENHCDFGCFCRPVLFRNRYGECVELPERLKQHLEIDSNDINEDSSQSRRRFRRPSRP